MNRQTSQVMGEIVRALTDLVNDQTGNVGLTARLVGDVAQIQVQVDMLETDLKDCVNELCLQCGRYKEAHKGACDECRWLNVKEGFRDG